MAGQQRWMENKIKRDTEERKREPYDPNKDCLQGTLDGKAMTNRQLHGQRKLKEMKNLAEKFKETQPTIGRTDLPKFCGPRNTRNEFTVNAKQGSPVEKATAAEEKRPSTTTLDWWKQRSGYTTQPAIIS